MKTFASMVLLVCGTGCDVSAPEAVWQTLGAARFESDGVTAPFSLPSGAAWALRVTSAAETCFQLASAIDVEGSSRAHRFSGPDCADCQLRTSTVPGAGVFVSRGLSEVRFGLVDCETLTPVTAAGEGVTVEARALDDLGTSPVLSVRLVLSDASTLDEQTLVSAVEAEFGGALSLRVSSRATVAAPSSKVRFHTGAPGELANLDALARGDSTVDVVVAGCLQYDDPFFGPPASVDGYTPRIPGGVGAADAVFLPALDCTTGRALSLPTATRARVLAHELGHYLGLFHADGANLMNPNPSLAASRGLSDAQRAVLRAHPIFQQP